MKNKLNDKFNRIFRLLDDSIALIHNHNDIQDFNKIIDLSALKAITGESQIIKAYNYFKDNIEVSKLDYQSILTNIMLVGIDIDSNEDEQQIFDTINSLGVRLTTGELLKNYFFNRNDVSSYETKWKNTFEEDEQCKKYWDTLVTAGRAKRTNIELFFYSYLQIKLQDKALKINAKDKEDFGKFEGLFGSYKNFIEKYKISKSSMIDEIQTYAKLYHEVIDVNVVNQELTSEPSVDRLNTIMFGLDNTTIIPYILFVQKNVTDSVERDKIFEYLESFLMRRIVCRATNKNYNNLFSETLIYNNVLTEVQLKASIATQVGKGNYMPDDIELKKAFLESRLYNKYSAGVLYLIETKIRVSKLHSTALNGLNSYTLEHLMPKKWEQNWGKLKNPDDIERRNQSLRTLGNLAIISAALNTSVSNANWSVKKKGQKGKYGLEKYASGIETLSLWLKEPTWDETTIEKRSLYLFEEAKKIWTL